MIVSVDASCIIYPKLYYPYRVNLFQNSPKSSLKYTARSSFIDLLAAFQCQQTWHPPGYPPSDSMDPPCNHGKGCPAKPDQPHHTTGTAHNPTAIKIDTLTFPVIEFQVSLKALSASRRSFVPFSTIFMHSYESEQSRNSSSPRL